MPTISLILSSYLANLGNTPQPPGDRGAIFVEGMRVFLGLGQMRNLI